jgi:hypothetical protein
MYEDFWYFAMFKPWRDRKKPCPGVEVVSIEDTPGIWGGGGKPKVNVIQFEIILKSSPNCDCDGDDQKVLYMEFFVRWPGGPWRLQPLDKKPNKNPMLPPPR